jgi:curli biogenesis system outer membrane secretion channel CsgG
VTYSTAKGPWQGEIIMNSERLITLVAALLTLVACASTDAPASTDRAGLQSAAPSCPGPKKRVAVLRFGGTGKYGGFEGWDVGEAMAARLATQLQLTGCFLIADRLALSEVLREQELGLAGVVGSETAPRPSKLLGAQVLIKGEITEFEPGRKGNGLTLGLGFDDIPLGLRLGGTRKLAHLAMDIRLLDASTGRVLQTHRVDSTAKSYGLALGVDYREGSIGTDNFSKTPFGEAAGKALVEAAGYILEEMRGVSWTGQVVEAQGSTVFLNVGRDSGIKVGDTFTVSGVARELVDPATGLSLGKIERPLGRVRVEAVDEKYSVAQMLGSFEVQRGDLLRR